MNSLDELLISSFFMIERDSHIKLSDKAFDQKRKQINRNRDEIYDFIKSATNKSIFYLFSSCSNRDFNQGIILRNYNNNKLKIFTPEVKVIDICYCSNSYRLSIIRKKGNLVLRNHRCSCNTFIDLNNLPII